ncbi:MAG: amino acid adenylation domain-containing protein [Anaerolineales bacterium]|nr:amino acid adenylation domain-containing protein [Anaerolineales bacterium]
MKDVDLPRSKGAHPERSPSPLSEAKRRLLEKRLQGRASEPPLKRIPALPARTSEALSFSQQRLWLVEQYTPHTSAYTITRAFILRGPLDIEALGRSLEEIVKRHEVLRTTFVVVEGQPRQVILPAGSIRLAVADPDLSSAGQRQAEIERLALAEARLPFDLASGPFLRANLWRLGENEHLFLLNIHHIVFDGWSEGIFLDELAQFYRAFVAGEPPSLPDLPIQYADYSVWQRQRLQGDFLEAQLAYWRECLKGIPPFLALPTDRPRSASQPSDGAVYPFALPKELTEWLRQLGRQERATPFMTLLAGFQALLFRYSGQRDIVVGVPITNRAQKETEGLIGFFINTLVLRTQVEAGVSFRALLGQVREMALGAYAHQELPFERLVEELNPERSLSYSPLVNILFAFQSISEQAQLCLEGVRVEKLRFHPGTTKFDLTLTLEESEEGLEGSVEYSTALFDGSTIERMMGQYRALLEGVLADPDRRLSTISLLSEGERRWLVEEWNRTATDYPRDRCVHELFEAQAERTPEVVALVCAGRRVTYGELNERANQLAHYLLERGVGPGTVVGICLERSVEMVVSILGILKAGGAYLPIDPTYPLERIAFMVENARLSVLLTKEGGRQESPDRAEQTIRLDADWPAIGQRSGQNPSRKATPDDLLYVIYTSGSTGKPKGSGVYHRSFTNLLHWFVNDFQLAAHDRVLLISSLSFDLTQKNLFAPLAAGGELHLLPVSYYDPAEIVRAVCDHGITWINCAPSAFYPLLDFGDESLRMKETLRFVFLGGEPIAMARLSAWANAPPGRTEIVNTYGPTECTDVCAFYRIERGRPEAAGIPIGKAISNARLYVLDGDLQIQPVGAAGELAVGGEGVGLGYLYNPSLTAEKFIPDPFSSEPGARMYRTGDLARTLPDGNIEFLGRLDHQVKIQGFRIELGEVETALLGHPGVKEAVVVVQEVKSGDQHLVAYYIPAERYRPTADELRRYLGERLPAYMAPSAFIALDAMPLSPNGKTDRRALMAREVEFVRENEFTAPRTAAERTLAKIWSETLGVEQIGIHDNFFDLGGDSILSIQMIARANQAGFRLTPKQLLQHQTIDKLAKEPVRMATFQAEQGPVTGPVALLLPIQRFLLEAQSSEPHRMNTHELFEVQQPWEPSWWEPAVKQLLLHHDALRSRFVQEAGGWRPWIANPDETVPFSFVELSGLSEDQQNSAIAREAEVLHHSLNLSTGPILRITYFDLGFGKPGKLLIVIHHLAFDGASWNILMEDFLTAWRQLKNRETIRLPPKTTSIQQWAERLAAYQQSAALRQVLSYWTAERWSKSVPLPADFPDGKKNNFGITATNLDFSLDFQETSDLLELCRNHRAQVSEVLLAAFALALQRWTQGEAFLLRLVTHGRTPIFKEVDLSRTIGFLSQLHPLLLDIGKVKTNRDVLQHVKEELSAIPEGGIGYGLLRYHKDKAIARQLEALPQPEVLFNYLGQSVQPSFAPMFRLADEPVLEPGWSASPKRDHIFDVTVYILDGRLKLRIEYGSRVHKRETADRLGQDYLQIVRTFFHSAGAC